MTTPMPPPEPLDAQERELARVLRALPGGEPPAALDAAILRAAANAAASSRRPISRLAASAGALWGIGGAAAAVLALGVAIQMRYSPDQHPPVDSAPRAQAMSDLAEDEAVQVELGEARREQPAFAAPPPPAQKADQPLDAKPRARAPFRYDAPAPATAAAPPPPAAPEAFANDALDEHVGRDSALNAIDVDSVESTTILTQEQLQRAEAKERDQPRAAKSAAAPQPSIAGASTRAEGQAGAAATGGLAAAPREAAPMKPATWLTEIRRLRDAGQIEAARARLVEFRRAYPQWVIPTDLAPLLSE